MEKNTIYAIVLSTLVIIGFTFVQAKFFAPQRVPQTEQAADAAGGATEENSALEESPTNEGAAVYSELKDAEQDGGANAAEETFFIQTGLVKATFTTRGGDLTGYELLSHIDRDTGRGVEMADNITAKNRALSLSLGTNKNILNDVFSYKRESGKDGEESVLFTRVYGTEQGKLVLGKKYTLLPHEYMLKLEVMVHKEGNTDGLSISTDGGYSLCTPPQIGPHYDPKVDRYEMRQFIAFGGDKKKKINVGTGQAKPYEGYYTWVGIAGKYFTSLVVPASPATMDGSSYSSEVAAGYANAQAVVHRRPFADKDMIDTYYVYLGPKNEKDLKRYNTAEENGWQLAGLRLTEALQSSGWLGWLEAILKVCLEALYKVIPNWGVAIILLTVLFKMATFPLTKKQSLGTLKMQALQPKIQALQEKYKGDPQKLQMETAKFYKENNYNPMSGCAPMLLQFLVIFAMYNLFNNYFEFRGASFIPGWIPDLSSSDSVYRFKKSIMFLGNRISILPFIYLATQLLYGKITQYGGAGGQSQSQMKFMMYGMPIVFFFVFYNAPSGLLLYWTVSNMIQMIQQVVINRIMARQKAMTATKAGQSAAGQVRPPKKRRRK